MKLGIIIDEIAKRNNSHYLLENCLTLAEHVEIYTLLHRPQKVLGPLKNRKITSSFLSQFLAADLGLIDRPWTLAASISHLKISPQLDLVISLCSGLASMVRVPDGVRHICVLCDDIHAPENLKGFFASIFRPYLKQLRRQRYKAIEHKLAINGELLKKWDDPCAQLISGAFKTDDYGHSEIIPREELYLCYTAGLTVQTAIIWADLLTSRAAKLFFWGPEQHLSAFPKEQYPHVSWLGDHCAADASFYIAQCRGVIYPDNKAFPEKALGALCCGRPVVAMNNQTHRQYLPEEVAVLGDITNKCGIESAWSTLQQNLESYRPAVLRRQGLRYNARLFKARLRKIINQ